MWFTVDVFPNYAAILFNQRFFQTKTILIIQWLSIHIFPVSYLLIFKLDSYAEDWLEKALKFILDGNQKYSLSQFVCVEVLTSKLVSNIIRKWPINILYTELWTWFGPNFQWTVKWTNCSSTKLNKNITCCWNYINL